MIVNGSAVHWTHSFIHVQVTILTELRNFGMMLTWHEITDIWFVNTSCYCIVPDFFMLQLIHSLPVVGAKQITVILALFHNKE